MRAYFVWMPEWRFKIIKIVRWLGGDERSTSAPVRVVHCGLLVTGFKNDAGPLRHSETMSLLRLRLEHALYNVPAE